MEEDKVVFAWELFESEFQQVIRDNRPDIRHVEAFWKEHGEEVVYYFRKAFAASMEVYDVGMLINDAIDAVQPFVDSESEEADERRGDGQNGMSG